VAKRVELKKRFFVAINFSKYKGRYVAVVGRRVVASGTNAKQVWLEAKRKNPTARPELHKVPEGRDARVDVCRYFPTGKRGLRLSG